MGLFSLYKPREYKPRYIYYDPKKEAKEARDKERNNEKSLNEDGSYKRIIKRGTFKEMAEKNKSFRTEQIRQANIRLVIIVGLLLALFYFLLH